MLLGRTYNIIYLWICSNLIIVYYWLISIYVLKC